MPEKYLGIERYETRTQVGIIYIMLMILAVADSNQTSANLAFMWMIT